MKIELEELEKVVQYLKKETREIKVNIEIDHGFVEFTSFDPLSKKITIKLFSDNTKAELIRTEKF